MPPTLSGWLCLPSTSSAVHKTTESSFVSHRLLRNASTNILQMYIHFLLFSLCAPLWVVPTSVSLVRLTDFSLVFYFPFIPLSIFFTPKHFSCQCYTLIWVFFIVFMPICNILKMSSFLNIRLFSDPYLFFLVFDWLVFLFLILFSSMLANLY